MRWKSVALVGAAWPAVAGCNIVHNAAHNIANEPQVVCTQHGIEHDLRKQARGAWQEVRGEYPRRAFTAEFRDGFLDGFVDYLDRGGNASLPAVPPVKYTRHKKYFTEEGQCLVKDYFLGFKYGQEIAIATGKRQFLTVPVLLPKQPSGPPPFTLANPGTILHAPPVVSPEAPATVAPIPLPAPTQPPVAAPPKPAAPVLPPPKPVPNSGLPVPPAAQAEPDRLPRLTPPLPTNPLPVPLGVNPPPVLEIPVAATGVPNLPRLPAPPAEVPELPAYIPTPSTWDELPIVPPEHTMPPVVPPTHPEHHEK